jgi:hypothetical protein
MKWTNEENEILREMRARLRPGQEIADKLNRPKTQVYAQVKRLGIENRTARRNRYLNDKDIVSRVKEMFEHGWIIRNIANEMEIPVFLIEAIIKNNQFKRIDPIDKRKNFSLNEIRFKKYSKEILESIKDLYLDKNLSIPELSKKLNLTINQVKYLISSYGMSKSGGRAWKDEETSAMIKMLDINEEIDIIAKKLRRTCVAIVHKCEKLKIQNKYPKLMKKKNELKNARYTLEKVIKTKLSFAKVRCTRMKMDYDLSPEYIVELFDKQDGRCFYTNKKMSYLINDENLFSIDRKDSSLGYIKSNIVLCIWDINRMKQDMSMERFLELCGIVSSKSEEIRADLSSYHHAAQSVATEPPSTSADQPHPENLSAPQL